jgi:hypothetical protein
MLVASINWVKWAAIAGIAAAVATVVLARVTYLLVRATKAVVSGGVDQVRATRDLAATAASALELQSKPHVLPVHETEPKMVWRDGSLATSPATLELQIQNVGSGVAQITRVEVRCGELGPPIDPETVSRVLVSGAVATIRADFAMYARDGWEGPPTMPAEAMARVDYRGVDDREFTTHFGWMLRQGRRWEVILNEDRELASAP